MMKQHITWTEILLLVLLFLSPANSQLSNNEILTKKSNVNVLESDLLGVPIEGQLIIPSMNKVKDLGKYEVTLNGGEYTAHCTSDGSFIFHNMLSGIYSLDVSSQKEYWPQFKIKVNGTEINAVEYKYPGAKRILAEYPLSIKAVVPVHYFEKQENPSILSMIMANPMMLMMGFSLLLMMGLPAMMKSLPPEELEQLTKNQAASGDPMKAMQKLMGMDNSKDDDDDDDDD